MALRREIVAVARLELAEIVRSRWLLVCLGIYCALAAIFGLAGLRESRILGFTGAGRVLFSLGHALVVLLPLLALLVTGQVVNRAREDGTLELLLSQPLGRRVYLGTVTAVRFAALALPLLVLLFGVAFAVSWATGQTPPLQLVARSGAVCAALLWAFVALGIAISVRVRSSARATTYLILSWAAGVALLDFALIGALLQWRLHPQSVFLLAALNPVQAARMALLAAAQPDLATLGPVGFFLVHRVGTQGLLALGVGWPLLFGILAWGVAQRSFRRGDLV